MPIYQYVCKDCDSLQDLKRTIGERDNEALCEHCSLPMQRIFNAPTITFNGPGFYSTGG